VHGGPWAHDAWGYDPEAQCFANRGYAFPQVNFRGSSGYGRRHITAAIGKLAGAMHDDLIGAARWAIAEGFADPTASTSTAAPTAATRRSSSLTRGSTCSPRTRA
jgi:dipeptidyl aminopeptidase/acylaminoacyl peptidase